MDLKEAKIREEIAFWQRFIEKWQAFRKEPVHAKAVESLAHAERKLQRYRLQKDVQELEKGAFNNDDRSA